MRKHRLVNRNLNGKLDRRHKSLNRSAHPPGTPPTREDALRLIQSYVDHYNSHTTHTLGDSPRFSPASGSIDAYTFVERGYSNFPTGTGYEQKRPMPSDSVRVLLPPMS